VCVASLEGNCGHLDEGWRHCDIAEALLESDSNAWILAGALLDKGCIATIRCDFALAAEFFRKVVALAEVNGSIRSHNAAESNSGYIQLLTGEFRKAEATLSRILSTTTETEPTVSSGDFLARVYLALGDLDQCERTLNRLNPLDDVIRYSQYGRRWAAITKAKLLLKQRRFAEVVEWLEMAERHSNAIVDRPFSAAVHLLKAQALHRLANYARCARQILKAEFSDARRNSELQAQFHYSIGLMVGDGDPYLASELQRRGKRIWASQGIVSIPLEIDDGLVAPAREERSTAERPRADDRTKPAINFLAAALDLGHSPRLLGEELVRALEISGCASNAAIVETSDQSQSGFDGSGRRIMLHLGTLRSGKTIAVTSDTPSSPLEAIVIADIFRIGRAALALEKARREERSRAALWPSDPIEEHGDALFVAEEMQTLIDTARRVAAANIPVLITGETGTGKEVLARLIHSYSPRAAKTFLPFNCTATPREMLDSQLFGHRKGAFTGATENFAGIIRAAGGGTLFLDEIGESTLDIQPKLLRFLESGEVHPIGETHPQRVDVRVIAATNADIDALVSQGRFREDLFYRLNIVRLHMPPLRERRVEIPAFANHYLQKYAKELGKGDLRLAEETMEYLVLYRWPGNVRQIANEMRRLAALAEPGAILMPEHLSADIAASRRTMPAAERTLDASEIVVRTDQPFAAAIQHLERAMVQAALARTRSVDEAAKLLGVSRKGLYLKRLRYGMEIERPKNGSEVA
jgi:DNA-binding NtrC family response regulator